ncbi:MAG: DEAD/DEAH box helicase [Pseudomonadota bacterium]
MSTPVLTPNHLHAYQRRAVEHVLENPRCALWLDMGLGKTASVLTAIAELMDQWSVGRTLIVGPKRVVERTWPTEIGRWSHTAHLTHHVIAPSRKRNLAAAIEEAAGSTADAHLVSRDNVASFVHAHSETRGRWPYDMLVIDEASSFKTPASQRVKALRRVAQRFDRVVELSGTPAPNGYHDLWSQLCLLDQGERLGRTVTAFRNRWFTQDYSGFGYRPRPGATEEIDALVADICMSMLADDYLSLPDHVENTITVSLPRARVREYRELEREFLLETEEGVVAAMSAGALSGKLRQFTGGAIYGEDDAVVPIHDLKLDALESVVAEACGPVVVAYQFRHEVDRIRKRFPGAREIGERGALDAYERGALPMLLAHPASAGHGLNELIHVTEATVWFSLPWSLEEFMQMNRRVLRQGRTRPVFTHYLVAAGTIDETLVRRLAEKDQTQAGLLRAVRADMEGRQ